MNKLTALLLVLGLLCAPAAFAKRKMPAGADEPRQDAPAPSSPASPSGAPAQAGSDTPANQIDIKKVRTGDDYVTLNFTNVDIAALVKLMSELTRRNFILDDKVTGKVTIMTPTKISPAEAYQVFLSALELKGFTAVEDGTITRVIPSASARQSGLKVLQDGDATGEGFVTKLIRMNFVNPQEIVRTVTPLISRDGNILAYPATNSVIVTDALSNLRKIENLIRALDVAAPEGKGKINVYYLKNANAEEIAKLMQALVSRLPTPAAGAAAAASSAPATILEGTVTITADKATNSLIIVGTPGDYEIVKDVIQKLDIRRRQVYVEVAIIEMSLSKLRDLGFEFQATNLNKLESGNNLSAIGGTNFGNIGTAIVSGPAALAQMSGLAVGAVKGTFKYNGTEYLSVGALLHALQTDGDVNVLSTPNILTMDNQKAEIMVGQNVPFLTGQTQNAITGTQTLFNSIERKDVGIKLTLTPQISSNDNVRLEVSQEISDVIASSATNAAGPTTSKRSASTAVVVKDRQTMVIGGLIRDNITSTTSKVPLLGDIPILGWLFKSKTTSVEKTNLMIFITPYIIKNEGEAEDLTKKKSDSLEEFRKEYRIEKKNLEPTRLSPKTNEGAEEPPSGPPADTASPRVKQNVKPSPSGTGAPADRSASAPPPQSAITPTTPPAAPAEAPKDGAR
ncbi:MAG TPA: type II secretion system secretin GspD [Nitrospirota bacterium]|nr:type II secretion system secretin GspD [Nitrospirota bacterium]